MSGQRHRHPMPFGAEYRGRGGTRFRLWGPAAKSVALCLQGKEKRPMAAIGGGWWELLSEEARAGDLYRLLIDEERVVTDPATRRCARSGGSDRSTRVRLGRG